MIAKSAASLLAAGLIVIAVSLVIFYRLPSFTTILDFQVDPAPLIPAFGFSALPLPFQIMVGIVIVFQGLRIIVALLRFRLQRAVVLAVGTFVLVIFLVQILPTLWYISTNEVFPK